MANYNVGNIEISATAKTNDTIAKLDKIIAKLQEVKDVQRKNKSSQSGVNSELDKTKTKIDKNVNSQKKHRQEVDNTKKSMASLSSSIKGAINLGKLYAFVNYTKRFITFTTRLITYASDYVEILNKFQVSFGKLTDENLQFVEKLSSAYGFSKSTLMDYQATFNNMLKSLEGLDDKTSAQLSRTLTQMAIDYSSLFNQSIESTMLAFQSMLSGSIRPIRSVSGFDVSETSIFAVYQELGGTKTMRQLTQLEKRLLRIIAVQKQMQEVGAVGDFYRTIETFSNQVKILQEQVKEFGATWGKLFLVKLKPVVQYINGFLIALNRIGQELTKTFDLTSDFNMDEEFAGLQKASDDTDEFTESVDNLNSSLTQLGLDQLNVLGGSSGGVSSMLEIDPVIRDGLSEYVSNLDKVNMKATEIASKILEWAGYQEQADGSLVKVNNNLGRTFGVIGGITGSIASLGLINKIKELLPLITNIGKVVGGVGGSTMAIIGAIVLLVVGFIDILTSGNEKSQEWIASLKDSYYAYFKPALENISNFLTSLMEILGVLYENIVLPLSEILGDILVDVVVPALGSILALGSQLLQLVMAIIQPIVEFLAPIIKQILVWVEDIVGFFSKVLNVLIKIVYFLVSAVSSLINMIIDGINFLIRGLNKIHFKLPDWLGGHEFGFNIKEVEKVKVGSLGEGLMDMGESFSEIFKMPKNALPNEYESATNTSSGSDVMADTVANVTLPMANAILEGNQEIAKAIKEQKTVLKVNGRDLAEATYDDINGVSLRKGELEIKKQM